MSDIANLNIDNSGLALSDQHNINHSEIQLANTDSSHSNLPVPIDNLYLSVLNETEEVDFERVKSPDISIDDKLSINRSEFLELMKEQDRKRDELFDSVRAQDEKIKKLAEVVFKSLDKVEGDVSSSNVAIADLRAEVEDNNKVIDARLTNIENTCDTLATKGDLKKVAEEMKKEFRICTACLLYTSDAADE